jgi:hypothetical protein
LFHKNAWRYKWMFRQPGQEAGMSLVGFTWKRPVGKPGYALVSRRWKMPRRPTGADHFRSDIIRAILDRPLDPDEEVEVVLLEPQAGTSYRPYSPLTEETGLFRIFADTAQTPEGCLGFASGHGVLGLGTSSLPDLLPGSEGVPAWIREIQRLSYLVALWELARRRDVRALADFVSWEGGAVYFGGIPPEAHFFNRLSRWDELSSITEQGFTVWRADAGRLALRPDEGCHPALRRGDLVSPTLLFCLHAVNEQLQGATPRMVWDEGREEPAIQIVPETLLSALYLQFALAIDGNRQYQRCPACSRWFQLAPGLNRANKQTCSGSCRTALHRQRAQQAVRLHAEGKTPRQIAKQVGSTVEKVKHWIEKHQQKGE